LLAQPAGAGGGGAQIDDGRGPQSAQSLQMSQRAYSEPWPPSSQSLSDAWKHVLMQMPLPSYGGYGGYATVHSAAERGPQSWQSEQWSHRPYSEPWPPSSQSPSEAW